jgi:hypothetical protein
MNILEFCSQSATMVLKLVLKCTFKKYISCVWNVPEMYPKCSSEMDISNVHSYLHGDLFPGTEIYTNRVHWNAHFRVQFGSIPRCTLNVPEMHIPDVHFEKVKFSLNVPRNVLHKCTFKKYIWKHNAVQAPALRTVGKKYISMHILRYITKRYANVP